MVQRYETLSRRTIRLSPNTYPFMIWCSDKYKKKYPAIINNIKKALHRSFRTDEICNVVFHISQLNTPYYRDKYDLLSPSFVPLDSVSQSMYN